MLTVTRINYEFAHTLTKLGLNAEQIRVLELAYKGLNAKEIANQLFISEWLVNQRLAKAYRTLGEDGRARLVSLLRGES